MAAAHQTVVEIDNALWVRAIPDHVGRTLRGAVTRWAHLNLPETSLRRVGGSIYVRSDHLPVISTYLTHRHSGKDFRAAWAALPDSPAARSVRLQLAWMLCATANDDYGLTLGALERGAFVSRSDAQMVRNMWRSWRELAEAPPLPTFDEARRYLKGHAIGEKH